MCLWFFKEYVLGAHGVPNGSFSTFLSAACGSLEACSSAADSSRGDLSGGCVVFCSGAGAAGFFFLLKVDKL